MKRILNISLWVLSVVAVIFLLAFTNHASSGVACSKIKINIARTITENRFLDSAVVMQEFADKRIALQGQKLPNINLAQLEDELNNNPYVKSADVFVTLDGNLTISLTERTPIMRVIGNTGDSYYIDEDGELMPLSDRYTAHVPVASGFITEKYSTYYTFGVKGIEADEKLKNVLVIDDLYRMVQFIKADSLWNAQIDQLYVLPGDEIQLVPKIGDNIIAFGTAENMEEKFSKLRSFYKHAVAQGTLNAYQTINLKYKNQVVCTKKL